MGILTMKTLKECIEEIINKKFSSGDYFDSHTIINELRRVPEYHAAYLSEFSNPSSINQYHSKIAKKIGLLECIQSCNKKIKTHTIYGDISENELWQKK